MSRAARARMPSRGPNRATARTAVLAALCALASLALPVSGCGRGDSEDVASQGPRLPVVEVQRVRSQAIRQTAEILGQLEPLEAVTMRAEIDGVIAEIGFEEGQEVREGQMLFRLRDDAQVARLQEARAGLRLAEDVHRRTQKLYQEGSISEAEVLRVEAERDASLARVATAQVELRRTVLRSPFDGVAGARKVSIGSPVEIDTDLVDVQMISDLELTFTIPEAAVPLARVGVPFELRVAAYPEDRFPGAISFVAPALNPNNRRLPLKGRVPNPDHKLRPGFFARGDVEIANVPDAVVIPEDAVIFGPRGTYVWRLEEGDVTRAVTVELGIRKPGRVQVTSGLAPGEAIVVAGTHKAGEGQQVEPKWASPETEAEGGEAPRTDG